MLGGAGCQTDLGRATFCHSLTVDGQPTVLKLLEELDTGVQETFTAKTGECSPCSEIRVGTTFDLEVHDPTDNLIAKRYLYFHPNIHTYLLSVHSDPDGTHVLDVMSYGSNVSCKQVRTAAIAGTPILLRGDSEGDEETSLQPPADPSETASSP
jgi:hypothetical protein